MSDTLEQTKTEKLLHSLEGIGVEDAFWMGDGDDLLSRLMDEDWRLSAFEAPYYWVAKLDGRFISYTEGDISFSDNPMCGER